MATSCIGHDKEYPNDALSLEFPGNSVQGNKIITDLF